MSSVGLSERIREGYAKKAAASKGVDECRGLWKERYFALIKHELFYYKKKEDNNPKGSIDMRAARVDSAPDSATSRPFCIRIAQAKQVFLYIQLNNEEDREKWGIVLRQAAGYESDNLSFAEEKLQQLTLEAAQLSGGDEAALLVKLLDLRQWTDRSESLCTFPGFVLSSQNPQDAPDRACLSLCHLGPGVLRLVRSEAPVRAYSIQQVREIRYSTKPELKLVDTTGVRELYSITLIVNQTNLTSKAIKNVFFVGTFEEAKACCYAIRAMKRGDLSWVKKINAFDVDQEGYIEAADSSIPPNFVKRYAVLTDRRILLFKTGASAVPIWVINLNALNVRDSTKQIKITNSLETVILRFENEHLRNIWFDNINMQATVRQRRLNEELVLGEEQERQEQRDKVEKEHREKVEAAQMKAEADERRREQLASANDAANAQAGSFASSYQAPTSAEVSFESFPKNAQPFAKSDPSFLVSFGNNAHGTLGNKLTTPSVAPVLIDSLNGKSVRSISVGRSHAAAVTEAGHVYCWGDGKDFQLGCGERLLESKSPYICTSLLRFGAMKGVACGSAFTLAISATGDVFGWGNNERGVLGLGESSKHLVKFAYPQPVEYFKSSPAAYISAGINHSAFIKATGELVLAGTNSRGCLGIPGLDLGEIVGLPTFCPPINRLGPIRSVSCGHDFTAAIVELEGENKLYAWGANEEGQLGVGDKADRYTPAPVGFPLSTFHDIKMVACGERHTVCLVCYEKQDDLEKNSIYTWGEPIANGFQEAQKQPVLVTALSYKEGFPLSNPVYVQTGHSAHHSTVINAKSSMFSFGLKNEFGELGNGEAGVQALVKVRLNASIQVVAGGCGPGFTITLAKGNPPARLGAKDKTAEEEPQEVQRKEKTVADPKFSEMDDVNGPNLEFAALQIAKLLNIEAQQQKKQATIASEQQSSKSPVASLNMFTSAPQSEVSQIIDLPAAEPVAPPPAAKEKTPLPPGWKKVKDEKSGRHYYYHVDTKETTWRRPKA